MNRKQFYSIANLIRPLHLTPAAATATPSNLMLFSSQDDDDKETVRVSRRRRPTSKGKRERADAPSRDAKDEVASAPPQPPSDPPGGGQQPPSSGGQEPSSGGQRPSRPPAGRTAAPRKALSLPLIGIIVVLFLCIGAFSLFNRSGDEHAVVQSTEPSSTQSGESDTGVVVNPQSAVAAVDRAGEQAEWLIMLYQDADDKILEKDIFVDFNEAERAGSGEQVHIVSQIDRYQTGYAGDGDWSGTKRFYVTSDGDLGVTASVEVDDLGEVNMADGDTLVDFVTWAVDRYPAEKHVLILSDHGMGWPGGWTDPTAPRTQGGGSPMEQRLSDQLFLNELDDALADIRDKTGIDKFELIGMDACLMAHIEVFSMLEPHARYAVASQETEPAVGWAYASFLNSLAQNPDIDGGELGRFIVDSYIVDDQRIVDDQARADMTGGRGGRTPSASQLTKRMEQNTTLSVIDLSEFPKLMESLNELAFELQNVSQKPVSQARSYAQSYTSIFGDAVPPSFIDLGNFVEMLAGSVRGEAEQAANRVQNAMDATVVAERHGSGKKGSNGISIYFPNSSLYRDAVAGYQSYGAIAGHFAENSLWDDYLTYHYSGDGFDAMERHVSAPPTAEDVRSPSSGDITVANIAASSNSVAPDETVLLSVDISGDDIGYIKLFAGFYDESSNSIYVADIDYLESSDTREIDGVYYPVWPEDEFTMEFEWEPIVFAVDDGFNRAEAVFEPQSYGSEYEEALYTVAGFYTYADDGEQRRARMQFRNEELEQVYGFTGEPDGGAPREIIPQKGDTFTVYEQWLQLNSDGQVIDVVYETGEPITFDDSPIMWETLTAAAGNYAVGFIVEDLDGKEYPVFTQIRVK